MRAVVMVLRGRFHQYWKSWLVLCGLVAVAGGSVLAVTAAGSRTAAAFPGFTSKTVTTSSCTAGTGCRSWAGCPEPPR